MIQETKEQLIRWADKCECAAFIEGDPVQFPHRYDSDRDIEVSAFISAWMAYGSRKVFLGILERLHGMMDAAGGPYMYIVSGAWRSLDHDAGSCLYRFYKWHDFSLLCERLNELYSTVKSLEFMFEPGEPL